MWISKKYLLLDALNILLTQKTSCRSVKDECSPDQQRRKRSRWLFRGHNESLILSSLHAYGTFTEFQLPRLFSRSGELRTQKLKSHLMRTQSLKVLPLKPGVGKYIAMLATLTARDFFFANFYPSGPFTFIFSKTSPEFFLC